MYQETIDDRSAWTGSELETDRSWIHELDDGDRAQLDDAVGQVTAQGLELADIGWEQFPLGSLAGRLARIGEEVEHGRGFAVLRGIDVDAYPLDELEKLYIDQIMMRTGGNKVQAARILGIDRKTLYRRAARSAQAGS